MKKNLIVQAKAKKQYAKVKARHQQEEADKEAARQAVVTNTRAEDDTTAKGGEGDAEAQIHPERQAMLDADGGDDSMVADGAERHATSERRFRERRPRGQQQQRQRQQRRPGYFDKSLKEASQKKSEADARAKEAQERREERERKIAERERYRKAMAKARVPGRDGKRKLGREGHLLLDKVKHLVGEK